MATPQTEALFNAFTIRNFEELLVEMSDGITNINLILDGVLDELVPDDPSYIPKHRKENITPAWKLR